MNSPQQKHLELSFPKQMQGNITIDVTVLDVNDNPPRVDNTLRITLREVAI